MNTQRARTRAWTQGQTKPGVKKKNERSLNEEAVDLMKNCCVSVRLGI